MWLQLRQRISASGYRSACIALSVVLKKSLASGWLCRSSTSWMSWEPQTGHGILIRRRPSGPWLAPPRCVRAARITSLWLRIAL